MDTTPCKACKAPLIWIYSARTGNIMPLDAEPVEDGNIVVLNGKAEVIVDDLLADLMLGGRLRYKSHFATCPEREKFRKARTTTKKAKE